MSLSPAEVQDRFRAAVLGLAVGDALGFPLRGVPPAALARLEGLAEDFAPRPRGKFQKGQFSDDTQLMLAAAESAVLEKRVDGRSIAAHVAWLWREGVLLQPPQSLAEACERLCRGLPWMSAGAPLGVKDPSVLSRAVVAGLWNADQPSRIAHDAGLLAIVTHKDPTCAAATAALGRGVALGLADEAMTPLAFCEALAQAASEHEPGLAEELRHLPRLLSWDTRRAFDQLRRVGVPQAVLLDSDGLPPHVVPVLLVAVFAALKAPHDFRQALGLVLRCGGEADVAAAACGALLGAHLGQDAIPVRLRRQVLYAEHLVETADRLFGARPVASPASAAVTAPRKKQR
ncbi:MAG TPA: ADP-ribosylglycohydrolase family protein [Myxococcaceae bacterium]|nr:ADP-ribosylglycohydrolase family protein [Myxococcaceae bacterium]